jgi:hypothetical protein
MNHLAVDAHFSTGRTIEAEDQIEQGAFPAAARAAQGYEAAALDREIDAIKRNHSSRACPELLPQLAHLDLRHRHGRPAEKLLYGMARADTAGMFKSLPGERLPQAYCHRMLKLLSP